MEAVMTVQEAAEQLKVCRGMIYKLMDLGQLEYVQVGRARRVKMAALEDYIDRNTRGRDIECSCVPAM